ncbi:MAG: MBL fold metallo-hydrolase [Actinobacteria bacterium]|nr:MAG: MBL fold metallo-hydrolase [Actinomycetota bacterium]
MEVIVLGNSASYPVPDNPCAGYLIRNGQDTIMLDIGNGVVGNLFRYIEPAKLKALVISHMHTDHYLDIYSLRLHLSFDAKKQGLPLYTPAGAFEKIEAILSPDWQQKVAQVFDFRDIEVGSIDVDSFKVSFATAKHSVDAYSISISSEGKKITYTGDTAYNQELIDHAKDSDLLISEATLVEPIEGIDHLLPENAAEIAKLAGVKQLMLTHIWPAFDKQASLQRAKVMFENVVLAQTNKVYQI